MTSTTMSNQPRLQNEYGADLWTRSPSTEYRHSTAGRGLFAGLQDVKHYTFENGWARRKSGEAPSGLLDSLWSKVTGGAYHPPTAA